MSKLHDYLWKMFEEELAPAKAKLAHTALRVIVDMQTSLDMATWKVIVETVTHLGPIRGNIEDVLQRSLIDAGETRESLNAAMRDVLTGFEAEIARVLPDYPIDNLIIKDYEEESEAS